MQRQCYRQRQQYGNSSDSDSGSGSGSGNNSDIDSDSFDSDSNNDSHIDSGSTSESRATWTATATAEEKVPIASRRSVGSLSPERRVTGKENNKEASEIERRQRDQEAHKNTKLWRQWSSILALGCFHAA